MDVLREDTFMKFEGGDTFMKFEGGGGGGG